LFRMRSFCCFGGQQNRTVVEHDLDFAKREGRETAYGLAEQSIDEPQRRGLAEAVGASHDHHGFADGEGEIVIEAFE